MIALIKKLCSETSKMLQTKYFACINLYFFFCLDV